MQRKTVYDDTAYFEQKRIRDAEIKRVMGNTSSTQDQWHGQASYFLSANKDTVILLLLMSN